MYLSDSIICIWDSGGTDKDQLCLAVYTTESFTEEVTLEPTNGVWGHQTKREKI